jgi:mRNA interferase MazF
MMQYDIWLANLNPSKGNEPGKVRPVVIIQTDLLNDVHPTVVICPVTTQVQPDAEILRVHLSPNQLEEPSDIMVDQIRAIDKKRLIKKIGKLKKEQVRLLKKNISILLEMY